jgi:glycosyltransferase involved in cell wall biosynthesis
MDDGWKVRTFHVIRGITCSARCTLIVFHPPEDRSVIDAARVALGERVKLITLPPPRAYTPWNLARGLLTRTPVHVWNQESARMRDVMRAILQGGDVDVVVSESTFLARYLERVPHGIPCIVDTHNIDSVTFGRYVESMPRGPRRWYAAATTRRLAELEVRTFNHARAVWVCSDVERELGRRMAPRADLWTVPNGVDTQAFAPDPSVEVVPNRILFFGRLDYYPNIDGITHFAREILPLLEAMRPDVELQLVGAAPTREVAALAESHPTIRLIGRVPDLRRAIASAAVVIVPLRVGGGTRLKVLEALSMAKPVVSTTIGAEGIAVESGKHIILADSPAEFAGAVHALLQDGARASWLGENGRVAVSESYDWSRISVTVARCLEEVVQRVRA